MSSLNKVFLIGRLGQDPELRHTTTGKPVANFSIATSSGKSAESGQEITEWHNITVWDKLAENCKKYLAKGKLCYVEGRLETQTATNGQRYTKIIAHAVQFLSPATENAHYQQQPQRQALQNLQNTVFKQSEGSDSAPLLTQQQFEEIPF